MPDLSPQDSYLTCRSCRNRFLYTLGERRRDMAEGLGRPPGDCPACRALEQLCRRRTGWIDWYNRQRGYGFVRETKDTSFFVHASDVQESGRIRLTPGMRISFVVQITDKGPRATDVELLREQE